MPVVRRELLPTVDGDDAAQALVAIAEGLFALGSFDELRNDGLQLIDVSAVEHA